MIRLAVLLAFFAAVSFAADRKIIYDPATAELSWTSRIDGKTKYVINLNNRTMTADGKQPKEFDENEQAAMLLTMFGLQRYVRLSEDWYPDPAKWERDHDREHQRVHEHRRPSARPKLMKQLADSRSK